MYEDYCLYILNKLVSVSKYQIAQVPSFDDQLPTWPVAQLVEHRTSTEGRGFESQPGQVDFSLLVRYGSSQGETPHYYSPPEFTDP